MLRRYWSHSKTYPQKGIQMLIAVPILVGWLVLSKVMILLLWRSNEHYQAEADQAQKLVNQYAKLRKDLAKELEDVKAENDKTISVTRSKIKRLMDMIEAGEAREKMASRLSEEKIKRMKEMANQLEESENHVRSLLEQRTSSIAENHQLSNDLGQSNAKVQELEDATARWDAELNKWSDMVDRRQTDLSEATGLLASVSQSLKGASNVIRVNLAAKRPEAWKRLAPTIQKSLESNHYTIESFLGSLLADRGVATEPVLEEAPA